MDYSQQAKIIQKSSQDVVIIADPFFERSASLMSHLRDRGLVVVNCYTVGDAMARCIELRPAFILTELRFPDGNGLELVRWISKHLPAARTVVHTWFADITTAVATVKAGAEDFVPKPTDAELLMNILLVGTKMVPADCGIETPNRVRQQHIEQVMKFSRSNVTLAARNLHLHRRSLSRMLKRYRALPLLPMPIER